MFIEWVWSCQRAISHTKTCIFSENNRKRHKKWSKFFDLSWRHSQCLCYLFTCSTYGLISLMEVMYQSWWGSRPLKRIETFKIFMFWWQNKIFQHNFLACDRVYSWQSVKQTNKRFLDVSSEGPLSVQLDIKTVKWSYCLFVGSSSLSQVFHVIAVVMLYCNSACNPILYNICNEQFRDGFREYFAPCFNVLCPGVNCKKRRRRASQRESEAFSFNTTNSRLSAASQISYARHSLIPNENCPTAQSNEDHEEHSASTNV